MSVMYKLELGPPATPDAVVAALVGVEEEAGGGTVVRAHAGASGTLRGGGWFDVDPAEDEPTDPTDPTDPHGPVESRFGFAPEVSVYLGLAKLGDLRAQETDVLRLALGVLARVPADALLHLEHDEVWLLRRRGQLTVNVALWTPDQLGLLRTHAYEPGPLAFDGHQHGHQHEH